MKLREQKRFGILWLVVGLSLIAVGIALRTPEGTFFSGVGGGVLAVGITRIARVHRLRRDPVRAADYEASLKDERTAYIANKARSMTFFVCILVQLAAGLIAMLFDKTLLIGQTLCFVTCVQCLVFSGTYWYYNRKY